MIQRIFLIGYMGAGKTTFGQALAQALHYEFVDTDQYIEQQQHRSISQIFAEHGETAFRRMEQEALADIAKKQGVVVATGGGLPCYQDNLQRMNAAGCCIYLSVPVEILVDRLLEARTIRPLLASYSPQELESQVRSMLQQRLPYYRQARYTVDASDLQTPERLLAIVENNA